MQQTLTDQVSDLKGELDAKAKQERALNSKVAGLEQAFKKKLDAAAAEAEKAKQGQKAISEERDSVA